MTLTSVWPYQSNQCSSFRLDKFIVTHTFLKLFTLCLLTFGIIEMEEQSYRMWTIFPVVGFFFFLYCVSPYLIAFSFYLYYELTIMQYPCKSMDRFHPKAFLCQGRQQLLLQIIFNFFSGIPFTSFMIFLSTSTVCLWFTIGFLIVLLSSCHSVLKIAIYLLIAAECKYQFQAWGECDLNTALKTRTGNLKRALHNADCQKTVTISKPCGKLTKPKPQGKFHLQKVVH